jgi:hypothetical protein
MSNFFGVVENDSQSHPTKADRAAQPLARREFSAGRLEIVVTNCGAPTYHITTTQQDHVILSVAAATKRRSHQTSAATEGSIAAAATQPSTRGMAQPARLGVATVRRRPTRESLGPTGVADDARPKDELRLGQA